MLPRMQGMVSSGRARLSHRPGGSPGRQDFPAGGGTRLSPRYEPFEIAQSLPMEL